MQVDKPGNVTNLPGQGKQSSTQVAQPLPTPVLHLHISMNYCPSKECGSGSALCTPNLLCLREDRQIMPKVTLHLWWPVQSSCFGSFPVLSDADTKPMSAVSDDCHGRRWNLTEAAFMVVSYPQTLSHWCMPYWAAHNRGTLDAQGWTSYFMEQTI